MVLRVRHEELVVERREVLRLSAEGVRLLTSARRQKLNKALHAREQPCFIARSVNLWQLCGTRALVAWGGGAGGGGAAAHKSSGGESAPGAGRSSGPAASLDQARAEPPLGLDRQAVVEERPPPV